MKRLSMLLSPVCLLLCAGCAARAFYCPERPLRGSPKDFGLAYERVAFKSYDGTKLTGWFVPAKGRAAGTVVHFHGNAENMGAHFGYVAWIPKAGLNLFTFDYRGYGDSEGEASRWGVYEDSVAAVDYVRSRPDVDPNRLILFGQSLGGSIALGACGYEQLKGVCGVAAESPFYSYRLVIQDRLRETIVLWPFSGMLAWLMIDDRYSPNRAMADVPPLPILLLHGTDDRVVPIKHSERLAELAAGEAELWRVEGARHMEILGRLQRLYAPKLAEWMRKQAAKGPKARWIPPAAGKAK